MLTATFVKAAAREAGFDLAGIAQAARHPKLGRLASWIAEGRAGDMSYLEEKCEGNSKLEAHFAELKSRVYKSE